MLDYYLMDATFAGDTFFTIDETQMNVTMCVEDDEQIISANGQIPILGFPRKITTFPLGENLFNYLAISFDNLKKYLPSPVQIICGISVTKMMILVNFSHNLTVHTYILFIIHLTGTAWQGMPGHG